MGRRASTVKAEAETSSIADQPTPLPRRASARLARASSISNTGDFDESASTQKIILNPPEFPGSTSRRKSATLEVAIPLKSQSRRSISSSAASVETSGDGSNEYNTPDTSVIVTPAESDAGRSKKRVSASTRAQELRSSTISLGTRQGSKRTFAATSDSPTETSDEALARALQAEEYRAPLFKRQKTSRNIKVEIADSAGDSSELSEPEDNDLSGDGFEQWQPPKTRNSLRRAAPIVVLDSEDDQDGEEAYQHVPSSVEAVTSESNEQPLAQQRRSKAKNAPKSRTKKQKTRARGIRSLTPPTAAQSWMTLRASQGFKERKKLEKQHPLIKKMWVDLRNAPPITPVAAKQPSGISRTLKSFQLEGLDWMMQQEKSQYKGGLLGDEMGMGKTIQAVSLLMSDYPASKPSLVVVPPVALMQWQSEIAAYTNGQLKVLVHHNTNPKVKGLKKKDLEAYDVIMISYSGLESIHRKEWKGWNRNDGIVKEDSVIHSIEFHRLILDEAHSIKQRTTSVARACFALKSTYKWCLSGTPVQNRIGEFFSLLRFLEVRPFACYFCKQCKCQQLHWSQDAEKRCTTCRHSGFSHVSVFNQEILNPIVERDNPDARKEALGKLRLLTDRIMLRRVKRDHTASMELPPKRVILHNEFFGEIERDFSRSIMTNSSRQFDTYVSRGVMLNNYANIFGLIMQMRQVSNHPDLILKKHGDSGQNVLVCNICDEPAEEAIRSQCRHEFCRQCAKDYIRSFDENSIVDCPRCHIPLSIDFEQPDIEQEEEHVKKNSIINRIRMEDWTSSTKIEMLVYELFKLRSKKQTHKSIVFSQFTSMLQLVEWRLRRAGFNTVMLDGTMTPAQRQKSIDYFMNNVDVEVFLVSLKAGGVALNLTEASRVFIVDPWWNPAAEWQSADRCHRIGQRRPCVITRLCIEDSVESRIVMLQEKKANLINGTLNKDQGEALEKLTPEDMQFLFRGA
ncbi:DNA repair protein rad16 [Aspergillus nanangensis]|uniref:DNA repair protein rad16 n=1 Tax=Aspergillus nanangensis TaxID=2582783 RepID=A0AAD4CCT4_ASPNN|nr:DNA repair protein rad16 [Aspergillus nanangensis]